MAAHLVFQTNNDVNEGICTGMCLSWCRVALAKSRPPRSALDLGTGTTIIGELGQNEYLGTGDWNGVLEKRGMEQRFEKKKTSGLFTFKSHRFESAAREASTMPGVYMICTKNHTMAACLFIKTEGNQFSFFDPNFGQYRFDRTSEFPSWYYQHVRSQPAYDLTESILIKLSRL